MSYPYQLLEGSLRLWVEMSPYLLLGMFIGGLIHAFLQEGFITEHLGDPNFSSVLKATIFGIPLPLCSCGVIPVAATLHQQGASRGAVLAFMTSTPTTGVDSILATYSLLGPLFAIFRPLASFLSGLAVGALTFLFPEEKAKGLKGHASQRPYANKFLEAFRYGFLELPKEIGKWLVLGVLVGGALGTFVPQGALEPLREHQFLEFLAVLGVAVPLYVCATGSIPIAFALMTKGMSPGAALVFLIAGPATNAVTVGFVYSRFGKRAASVYLLSVIGSAFLLGWTMNALWRWAEGAPEFLKPGCEFLPHWLKELTGAGLLLVVGWAFLRSRLFKAKSEVVDMKYTFTVPSMNCEGCKARIEEVLKGLEGVRRVVVDLKGKKVGVEGEVPKEAVEEALHKAGYPVSPDLP